MTSSLTVNSGSQLTPIAADGAFQFGTGVLTLNGSGPTTGPFAAFPGAIRQDTDRAIRSEIRLSSSLTRSLHVQGAALGILTLTNT
jgi:hypothetical protein